VVGGWESKSKVVGRVLFLTGMEWSGLGISFCIVTRRWLYGVGPPSYVGPQVSVEFRSLHMEGIGIFTSFSRGVGYSVRYI